MNTEFSRVLSSEMKKCNDSKEYDSVSRVQGQLDEVKDIMVKNVENLMARGERLDLLVNKTETLRDNVSSFNGILSNLFVAGKNFESSISTSFLKMNYVRSI